MSDEPDSVEADFESAADAWMEHELTKAAMSYGNKVICAYVPREVYTRIERACKFPEGDPAEVQSADSRAESQSALNGPSGSPTSPSGRVSRDANSHPQP